LTSKQLLNPYSRCSRSALTPRDATLAFQRTLLLARKVINFFYFYS
jgi:hypothetical protein